MNKRKIFMLALSIMMVAILAVGGSLAYLVDTDSQKNTFTAGFVGIELDEAVVEETITNEDGTETKVNTYDEDDNIVAEDVNNRTSETQNYKLHPGMTVHKDPTIWVDEDSEKTYLGAIVTIDCAGLYKLIGVENYETIDIHALVSGGLVDLNTGSYGSKNGLTSFTHDGGVYTIYQEVVEANKVWKLYIVLENEYAGGSNVLLFDTLTIPAEYDNDEMKILNGMTIDINAYAVQMDGFDDATTALTTAFAEDWVAIK